MNFQHLNQSRFDTQGNDFTGRHLQRMHRLQQSVEDVQPYKFINSDAHLIAISMEAKQNPIQALYLIAEGIPHQQAIARLKGCSARQLGRFTQQAMENAYPGWELLDAEDQNMAAFHYSMINGDANGYRAGFNAALSALEKFIEPILHDYMPYSVSTALYIDDLEH